MVRAWVLGSPGVAWLSFSLLAGCGGPAGPGSRPAPASAPPALTAPGGSTLEGRVCDPQGKPVVGARVLLFGALDLSPGEKAGLEDLYWSTVCGMWLDDLVADRTQLLAETASTLDGSYRFDDLEDGAYTLRVTAPGFAFKERDVVLPPARS